MSERTVFVGNLSWDTRWQGLKDHMRQAGNVVHAEVFSEASGRSAGCGIVEYESKADAMHAITALNNSTLDGRQVFVREDRDSGRQPRGGGADGGGGGFFNRGGGGGGFGGGDFDRSFNDRGFDRGGFDSGFDRGGDQFGGRGDYHRGDVGGGDMGGGGGGFQFGNQGGGGGGGFRDDRGRKVAVTNLPYQIRWQELKDIFRSCGEVIRADVLTGPDGRSKGVGTIVFESEAGAQEAISRLNEAELDGRVIYVRYDRYYLPQTPATCGPASSELGV
eukprot:CAMPEP_0184740758 /NCGR_PEP_ID=MMETSP0315-20130426/3774_1 /TAXON_ID=101924 /ORGANISM="Rhodosorus marinus, Strain UTEX LB 2760" /LENGTH=275 /DNA_ID=CAMNT_0027210633 /DNA_START=221 /DNA_END=1049 /DNA_ORIENTATION=+